VQSLEQGSSAPQTALNAYQTFAPTISKQFELGAKTEFETWSTNLALFRVDRGLQYLNSNNVFVQNGQTRYQGIDWSAQMSLSQNWTLLGGVMYLDTSDVRAAPDVDGKRAYGAPRTQGSLYVEYAVPQIAGLVLNAGGRYVGNEAIEADNSNFIGGGPLHHLIGRSHVHLSRRHRQSHQRKILAHQLGLHPQPGNAADGAGQRDNDAVVRRWPLRVVPTVRLIVCAFGCRRKHTFKKGSGRTGRVQWLAASHPLSPDFPGVSQLNLNALAFSSSMGRTSLIRPKARQGFCAASAAASARLPAMKNQ